MCLEFPFEYYQLEGIGNLFYPTVYLDLKTKYGWKKFPFLVDTGADVTTLPSHLLSTLDVNQKNIKKSKAFGIGGVSVISYEFKVEIKIGEEMLTITANAVEVKNNSMPLLLGRKDIFEKKFSLIIDSKNQKTIISKN